MECLYTAEVKVTRKEFRQYYWFFQKKRKGMRIYLVLFAAFCLYRMMMSILDREIFWAVFYGAFTAFFLLYVPVIIWLGTARRFRKRKLDSRAPSRFEFFDTYFVRTEEDGFFRMEYRELYGLAVGKEALYLMHSAGNGSILPKRCLPEGAVRFLTELGLKGV